MGALLPICKNGSRRECRIEELGSKEFSKVDQTLHRNAIYQMAHTTDMPVKFLDSLQAVAEPWGRELIHHLQTVFNCPSRKSDACSAHCSGKCADFSPIPIAASIRGPGRGLLHRGAGEGRAVGPCVSASYLVYKPSDHAGGDASGAPGQTLGRVHDLFRADV